MAAITNNSSPYDFATLFPVAKFKELSKTHAVHFYLANNPNEKQIEYIKKCSDQQLNLADPQYGLTPLHIAAMKGNSTMVDYLLSRNVVLTVVDKKQYTVLHHLQICQNKELIRRIKKADKNHVLDSMRTVDGKTPEDLKNLLSKKPAAPHEKVFSYLDPETNSIVEGATAETFQKMTGAQYTKYQREFYR